MNTTRNRSSSHLESMEKKRYVGSENRKVSTYISDDIAVSILSKLPLKSFKRFQCVRKSWSLLFENHHFKNMFRTNFFSNSHRCSYYDGASLLLKVIEHNKEVLYSFSGERFKNKIKLDFSNPFFEKDNIHVFGFGSINGTFCLHEYQEGDYEKIVLWNPATQTFNLLPPSEIESAIPDEAKIFIEVLFYSRLHGFGYDHFINDYKVIRDVQLLIQPSYQYSDYVKEITTLDRLEEFNAWEIYSLRSNSWRKLYVNMPSSWECIEGTRVYMDGVCHWLCTQDDHVGPCLVSFHLSNDVFFVTPIPSNIYDCSGVKLKWVNLVVLNGYVALISYHEKMTTFHVSILGEIGMKESWTELIAFEPLPYVERPIRVGVKGEIFFKRKDKELAWFDLSTQMVEMLGCKGEGCSTRIIIYKEAFFHLEE